MLFAGLRFNEDHKEHVQNDFTSAGQSVNADGQRYITDAGIFLNSTVNETCWGYGGINKDADGNAIPDDRTFRDSKVVTWNEPTWAFGVEYSPTDSYMLYGRISRGFRAGGFAGFGNAL